MSGAGWLALFLALSLAALAGLFFFGWRRRKDKPPKVDPLPPDEDDDWDR